MNTKSIKLETIIAGFFLLIVILLFILLRMTDEELSDTSEYFQSISAGATAIILTLAFGFSYILGSLSHRIGSDLSTLYYKIRRKNPPQTHLPTDTNKKEYYNKWLVKSFYRTLMLSSPFIVLELIVLDNRLWSGIHIVTILLIAIVLEVILIISFLTQRYDSLNNR